MSKVAHWLCVLQALKKAFSDGNFTWQQPDSRPAPTRALGDGKAFNKCIYGLETTVFGV